MRIGIVEDELLVADSMSEMLKELGYEVSKPAISYSRAIKMIEDFNPELLLLDIQLAGSKDGIELAETVRTSHNMPVIFLTANSDAATINRAKNVKPNAFLVKPFTQNELFAAIEIASHNFTEQNRDWAAPANPAYPNILMVKDSNSIVKVYVHEILYLQAEHVYVTIHLKDGRKLTVRSGLKDYLQNFDPRFFYLVHRSYAANLKHVHKIEGNEIVLNRHRIPIGKTQKEELLQRLQNM
jgi:DNA-binding LytR/AlgR family response regulator